MSTPMFEFTPPRECERPYTVSEINAGVARIIESANTLVWVQAEISNFKRAASGHCYLTLKDGGSRIPAVIWRSVSSKMTFEPENGMEVMAIASLRVYQRGGYYQLDIHRMQPGGLGALYLAFEKLKKRLAAEGLFDAERKKQLPETVRRLGVITSKRGAALRDIVKVVRSRGPMTDIVVIDVPVQGDAAAPSIAAAIADMNACGNVDCMIVGRGGGSLEDLWAFNEEVVARAISVSDLPVISAVGHEVDFTIADFVADIRAPTPSAAAEIAVADTAELTRYFGTLLKRFAYRFLGYWNARRERLRAIRRRPGLKRPWRLAAEARQRHDELQERQYRAMGLRLSALRERTSYTAGRLRALSPLAVLSRGYSVVMREDGGAVKDAAALAENEIVALRFHRGGARARIVETRPRENGTSPGQPPS